MTYETRVTRLTVAPKGEPLFSEKATHVEITDESAGEYIKIYQCRGREGSEEEVLIDPDEWPAISDAVERILEVITK